MKKTSKKVCITPSSTRTTGSWLLTAASPLIMTARRGHRFSTSSFVIWRDCRQAARTRFSPNSSSREEPDERGPAVISAGLAPWAAWLHPPPQQSPAAHLCVLPGRGRVLYGEERKHLWDESLKRVQSLLLRDCRHRWELPRPLERSFSLALRWLETRARWWAERHAGIPHQRALKLRLEAQPWRSAFPICEQYPACGTRGELKLHPVRWTWHERKHHCLWGVLKRWKGGRAVRKEPGR